MSRPEPCDVGDHYSCERTTCKCACHPRFSKKRKTSSDEPLTTMRGATWHSSDLDVA